MVWIDIPAELANQMFAKGFGGKACGKAFGGGAYVNQAKGGAFGKAGGKGAGFPHWSQGAVVPQGKGGGKQFSKEGGARKRKAPSDEPVAPLDEETRAGIEVYIQENGGTVTLGKLTSSFEGLKKAQVVEAGFSVNFGTGDELISMPGTDSLEANQQIALAGGERQPRAKKAKKERDPNAEVLPLDASRVEEIRSVIAQAGGQIALGRLSTWFEGVKKKQLEAHFELVPTQHDFDVHLVGSGRPAGFVKTKVKKEKAPKDPNAPPPPALLPTQVEEIATWLSHNGGSSKLGKLSTVFEGVKKAQIEMEAAFQVLSAENGDPTVMLA